MNKGLMLFAKTAATAFLMFLCIVISVLGVMFGATGQVFGLLNDIADELTHYIVDISRYLDES